MGETLDNEFLNICSWGRAYKELYVIDIELNNTNKYYNIVYIYHNAASFI